MKRVSNTWPRGWLLVIPVQKEKHTLSLVAYYVAELLIEPDTSSPPSFLFFPPLSLLFLDTPSKVQSETRLALIMPRLYPGQWPRGRAWRECPPSKEIWRRKENGYRPLKRKKRPVPVKGMNINRGLPRTILPSTLVSSKSVSRVATTRISNFFKFFSILQ